MKCDGNLVHWAADTSTSLLAPLGNRWLHVQGVAERARWVGKTFHDDDRSCLIAAAYMHDIGYAPALKKTGFHPLDGACYLRSLGYDRLASLVAHHSEARFEASLRGYEAALNEFPCERSAVADALTYCDLTTGPTGEPITLKERAAEISSRYGDTDMVTQSLRQSMPFVSLAVARTSRRLYRCGLLKRARQ
jgi:hypothetical protein